MMEKRERLREMTYTDITYINSGVQAHLTTYFIIFSRKRLAWTLDGFGIFPQMWIKDWLNDIICREKISFISVCSKPESKWTWVNFVDISMRRRAGRRWKKDGGMGFEGIFHGFGHRKLLPVGYLKKECFFVGILEKRMKDENLLKTEDGEKFRIVKSCIGENGTTWNTWQNYINYIIDRPNGSVGIVMSTLSVSNSIKGKVFRWVMSFSGW
jgi:hypothetical protein